MPHAAELVKVVLTPSCFQYPRASREAELYSMYIRSGRYTLDERVGEVDLQE